jgi:hypothetical protein
VRAAISIYNLGFKISVFDLAKVRLEKLLSFFEIDGWCRVEGRLCISVLLILNKSEVIVLLVVKIIKQTVLLLSSSLAPCLGHRRGRSVHRSAPCSAFFELTINFSITPYNCIKKKALRKSQRFIISSKKINSHRQHGFQKKEKVAW